MHANSWWSKIVFRAGIQPQMYRKNLLQFGDAEWNFNPDRQKFERSVLPESNGSHHSKSFTVASQDRSSLHMALVIACLSCLQLTH
jgi:hypothetical protein